MKKTTLYLVIMLFTFHPEHAVSRDGILKTITKDYYIQFPMAVSDDAVWFAYGHSIARVDKKNSTIRIFSQDDNLPDKESMGIAVDSRGRVISVFNQSPYNSESFYIMHYDGTSWTPVVHMRGGVSYLATDPLDGFWCIHYKMHEHGSIMRWNSRGDLTLNIADAYMATLYVASDSTVWCSGNGKLYSLPYSVWKNYTKPHLIEIEPLYTPFSILTPHDIPDEYRYITCISEAPDGAIWFGNNSGYYTSYGLVRYDGTEWTLYSKEDGLVNNMVHAIAFDRYGALWVGTGSWISRLKNGVWTTFERSSVRTIAVDNDNVVWFGSPNGLYSFTYETTSEVNDSIDRKVLALDNPYPNPFNTSTTIAFSVPVNGSVSMIIYSVTGQKIRELRSEYMMKGRYRVVWDGKDSQGNDAPSGVYFVQLKMQHNVKSKRLLLMK